jgi:hypothetical protein
MSYMIITFKFNLIHSVWNHLYLPLNLNIIDLFITIQVLMLIPYNQIVPEVVLSALG